jgi:hypothetical protein
MMGMLVEIIMHDEGQFVTFGFANADQTNVDLEVRLIDLARSRNPASFAAS